MCFDFPTLVMTGPHFPPPRSYCVKGGGAPVHMNTDDLKIIQGLLQQELDICDAKTFKVLRGHIKGK